MTSYRCRIRFNCLFSDQYSLANGHQMAS